MRPNALHPFLYKQLFIPQTYSMWKFIKRAISYANQKRLTTVAGAWVFFFLTSVVPLAFLLITAFGVFGVDITRDFVSRLPEEFRTTGEAIATTAEKASKGTTILFLGSVIFSCTTLLNQMSKDGDFLYGYFLGRKRGIFRRGWALISLGILFIMFLSLAFIFAFGGALMEKGAIIFSDKLFLTMTVFLLAIIFGYVIIIVLNRFISPIKLHFGELWLGSFVSLFIVVLGTIGYIIYLRIFNSYNAFYGSLAAIVVFLLWSYIIMLALVVGVIINAHLKTKSQGKGDKYVTD